MPTFETSEYAEILPESMDEIFADELGYFRNILLGRSMIWDRVLERTSFWLLCGRFDRTVGIEILLELSAIAQVLCRVFMKM